MGTRGPAPTPTAILKLHGSKHANRPGEPKPRKGAPRCPSQLSQAEKAAWKQLVAVLKETKVLTVADGNALARYCVMWCEWWKCDAFVKKYGISFAIKRVVDRGKPTETTEIMGFQPFPELTQRNKLSVELRRLEAEFGLTPAARARIQVGVTESPAAVQKRERRA